MTSTFKEAWRGARTAFGFGPASRAITVRPDDVFLVSYPRSGNTWLRFLVTNLVDPTHPTDFLDIERRAPDIYANSNRAMMALPRPRLLKSHEYLDPRYPRVLYVVRDPRDVVASYYRWQVKFGDIPDGFPAMAYIERFLGGGLDRYGSWQTHVGGWVGARDGDPEFRIVRYEDMLYETETVAGHLCQFLGLARSESEIAFAVEQSSRERMQELEHVQGNQSTLLRGWRSDIPFVGDGKSSRPLDDNEKHLRGDEARRRIERKFGMLMRRFGYA